MSVAGYFGKRGNELRMPKSRGTQSDTQEDAKNDLRIRYEGPVLNGEKSVEHQHRDDAIRASSHLGESYKNVEDYDPVLRAHCRL